MIIILGKSKMSFKAFLFLFVILAVSLPLIIYANSSTNKDSLNYIFSFQDKLSGGVKEEFVDEPQPLETDWAIMAFSSSGYDPSTVGTPKDMIDFAVSRACTLSTVTDIERRVLALESAGIDTHVLDSCSLPQKIIDATEDSGRIGDGLVSTVFGILALSASGESVLPATVAYIIDHQNENGGWDSGWGVESNFTSQVIMALVSSGQEIDPPVIANAKSYLKSLQTNSGGIKYDDGEWSIAPDAFSDSYALQAIYSLGESPSDSYWLQDGNSILSDLENLRNNDGSFSFSGLYGNMNPVWTTSVVLIGINRNFLPICQSDLISWVGEAVTSSPTPTVSASPSQSPSLSPSSTVVPASPAFSSNPDSYQTEKDLTVSAVESTGSKNKSESIPAVADSQPVSAGVSPDSMQSSASVGKVLSDSANQLKNGRRWVATILAFSVLTGILIAFIEKKYVKN